MGCCRPKSRLVRRLVPRSSVDPRGTTGAVFGLTAPSSEWQRPSVRERLGTLWLVLAVLAGGAPVLAPQTAIAVEGCCLIACTFGAICADARDVSCAERCEEICGEFCLGVQQEDFCPEGSSNLGCSLDPVCFADCATHTPTPTPTQTPTITPTPVRPAAAPTVSGNGLLLLTVLLFIVGMALVRRRYAR